MNVGTTLFGVSAALVWGTADFTGGVSAKRAPAIAVVAIAHSSSLLLLLVWALVTRAPVADAHSLIWGLSSGIAGSIGLICFYRALSLGQMGLNAAVAGLITAAIPVLFSFLRSGTPGAIQLAGFALATLSIVLIAYTPGTSNNAARPKGLLLAIAAGIGFGILLLGLKFASANGVLWPQISARISSVIIAGAASFPLLRRHSEQRTRLLQPATIALAVLAGVLDTAGNILYMLATRAGRLDVAAMLSSLYPAATILLAHWLLKERTTRLQTTGMVLALAAVALISI
jgi:drug/metabolite transporter (DMT)-like permease